MWWEKKSFPSQRIFKIGGAAEATQEKKNFFMKKVWFFFSFILILFYNLLTIFCQLKAKWPRTEKGNEWKRWINQAGAGIVDSSLLLGCARETFHLNIASDSLECTSSQKNQWFYSIWFFSVFLLIGCFWLCRRSSLDIGKWKFASSSLNLIFFFSFLSMKFGWKTIGLYVTAIKSFPDREFSRELSTKNVLSVHLHVNIYFTLSFLSFAHRNCADLSFEWIWGELSLSVILTTLSHFTIEMNFTFVAVIILH